MTNNIEGITETEIKMVKEAMYLRHINEWYKAEDIIEKMGKRRFWFVKKELDKLEK